MESEQPYESLYDQARRTTRQPTGRDLASRASDAVTGAAARSSAP